jgi:hypothetical protein
LLLLGLSNEYLFKSEGEKKVLQQLVSLYNEDSGAPFPDGVNPIDVAALIKCYLASIPEPLTTFSLYDELRDARVSIADLRNILKKLPNVNYMTLEFVTALLLRVSRKSSLNKVYLILISPLHKSQLLFNLKWFILWLFGHFCKPGTFTEQ